MSGQYAEKAVACIAKIFPDVSGQNYKWVSVVPYAQGREVILSPDYNSLGGPNYAAGISVFDDLTNGKAHVTTPSLTINGSRATALASAAYTCVDEAIPSAKTQKAGSDWVDPTPSVRPQPGAVWVTPAPK